MRRFGYNLQPLSETDYAALAKAPGWSTRALDASEGVRLRGLERAPSHRDAPWIIFFTGNEGHPLEEGQRFLDALTAGRDWGGAVWAYRGFDGSGGTPDAAPLEQDGWEQYRRLTEMGGRVHVVGFSLGTSIAASVAAKAKGQPPASLTLLAPFIELEMQLGSRWTRHRYETSTSLDAVTTPTLVVHGLRDDVLPVDGSRTIAAKLGARARYIELGELGHLDLPLSKETVGAVRTFIEEHSR